MGMGQLIDRATDLPRRNEMDGDIGRALSGMFDGMVSFGDLEACRDHYLDL